LQKEVPETLDQFFQVNGVCGFTDVLSVADEFHFIASFGQKPS
jgi:hypothetical protein